MQAGGRRIASKTIKQAVLEKHLILSRHIPPTRSFTKSNLINMLKQYGMVYVKPNVGSGGFSILRVEKNEAGYRYQIGKKVVVGTDFETFFTKLKGNMKYKTYIIQMGVNMLKINGSPVDYRVKYVREGHSWRYKAVVGRVARSGLIVTNLHQGGRLLKGLTALRKTVGNQAVEKKREMKKITEISTKALLARFPGLSTLGFDYGVDTNGKIWIFEVNTNPN